MSNLTLRKFNKIMDHRDNIQREASSAISSLNSAIGKGVDFCILLEEDPSGYFASNGDKQEIRQDFENVLATFTAIMPTIQLIEQLKNEEITVSQFRTSLSKQDFNTSEYQDSLTG